MIEHESRFVAFPHETVNVNRRLSRDFSGKTRVGESIIKTSANRQGLGGLATTIFFLFSDLWMLDATTKLYIMSYVPSVATTGNGDERRYSTKQVNMFGSSCLSLYLYVGQVQISIYIYIYMLCICIHIYIYIIYIYSHSWFTYLCNYVFICSLIDVFIYSLIYTAHSSLAG